MKFTMTAISERQHVRFIYTTKTFVKRFYTQEARNFAKSKIISVTFYKRKARQFTLRNFSWKILNLACICNKHDIFRYVNS